MVSWIEMLQPPNGELDHFSISDTPVEKDDTTLKATSVFADVTKIKDEKASVGSRGILVPSFEFKTRESRTRYWNMHYYCVLCITMNSYYIYITHMRSLNPCDMDIL